MLQYMSHHMRLVQFIWAWGGNILAILVSGWAFWRGGAPERWGAVILLTGWVLSAVLQSHDARGPGIFVVLIDVACLIAFVGLSLWSRRVWTIVLAAFQLDAVMCHFAVGLSGHIGGWAYVTALGIWGGYGPVFALAGGLIWPAQRAVENDTPDTGAARAKIKV